MFIGICFLLILVLIFGASKVLLWIVVFVGLIVALVVFLLKPKRNEKQDAAKEFTTMTTAPIPVQPAPIQIPHIIVDMPDEDSGPDLYRISDRQALNLREYYVLDVETTGLNKEQDRIVEIAWIKVSNGDITDSFCTLVNPEIPISPAASRVNGIHDADVANAPKYNEIREKVKTTLLDTVVVGHNVQFDLGFIKELLDDVEGRILYLDTVKYARKAFPGMKDYKLATLCKELSLYHQCTHRSDEDVQATKELFERCQAVFLEKDRAEKAEKQRLKEVVAKEREKKYSASSLYNCAFVFTGGFTVPRDEMISMAESVGALVRTSVSLKTDYLVVGDLSDAPNSSTTKKLMQADAAIAKGGKVQKITEETYRGMILAAKQTLQ